MRGIWIALAGAMAAAPAMAGVHPAEVEQGLAFIAGDWTIQGQQGRYRDQCRWFDGRSFIICDTDDRRHGTHHSIAILGWSAAEGHYTYQQYDDSGRGRNERCFANADKGLTCLGEAKGADGLIQTRTSIWPTAGGLGLSQEKSVNAGPWAPVGRVDYIPRRGSGRRR